MRVSPAARAAARATAVIAVVYVLAVIVLNVVASSELTEQADDRLSSRLTAVRHDPALLSQPVARSGPETSEDAGLDADGVPVFLWSAGAAGSVVAHSPQAPSLPASLLAVHPPRDGLALTASLGPVGPFRLKPTRDSSGWLVAGQSRADDAHTPRLLLYAELIAGPFLLLAMFGGSFVVGRTALAPVEQSRLRQLVDDMLWLARFDSRPPPPSDEPVDLVTLAQAVADRFRVVGPVISAEVGTAPALISAPPEWIDRLAGVLMDNACRYAGADGQVRIAVRTHGSRVTLTVEDSGPGIPSAERPRLFDRFQVSWRHSQPHRPSAQRLAASHAPGAGT
jgi:Histidine kinase-, DNA gyrase B-, and HSP90-like ATPase